MQIPHAAIDFASSAPAGYLYWTTAAVGGLWLAWTAFDGWRRREANLTPVHAAGASGETPDFLRRNDEARDAARARGEAYGATLDAREAAAAADDPSPARSTTGWIALGMSAVTLLSMIVGSIAQVQGLGRYAEELKAGGRLRAVISEHPVAFAVAAAVIVIRVAHFLRKRSAA